MIGPWTFRVTPSRASRAFFTVKAFPTKAAMLAYDKQRVAVDRRLATGDTFLAKTYLYRNTAKPTPFHIGEILLNREDIEFEYVAHEATHAALWWARSVAKLRIGSYAAEEEICGAVGRLTQMIIARLKRATAKGAR